MKRTTLLMVGCVAALAAAGGYLAGRTGGDGDTAGLPGGRSPAGGAAPEAAQVWTCSNLECLSATLWPTVW